MHFTAEGAGHHLFVFTPPLPLVEEGGEEDEELGNVGRSRCRMSFCLPFISTLHIHEFPDRMRNKI